MFDMIHDYSDVTPSPNDSKLAQLLDLMEGLKAAEKKVAAVEVDLAVAKSEVKELEEDVIPELMDEIRLPSGYPLPCGGKLVIENQVFTNITKANKVAAFNWLQKHGHGGMIKEQTVRKVNGNTLKAWAKRLLEKGEDVPSDLFGLYQKRVVKIKHK